MTQYIQGPTFAQEQITQHISYKPVPRRKLDSTKLPITLPSKPLKVIEALFKNYNAILSGGCALALYERHRNFNDIDFWFQTEEELEKARLFMLVETNTQNDIDQSYQGRGLGNAYTYHLEHFKVQLIKMTIGSPKQIIDGFDFENCKIAIKWDAATDTYPSIMSDKLQELIEKKKVMYRRQTNLEFRNKAHKELYAEANLWRIEKYLSRFPNGTIDDESRTQIIQQLAWDLMNKPQDEYYSVEGEAMPRNISLLLNDPATTLEDLVVLSTCGKKFRRLLADKSKQEK